MFFYIHPQNNDLMQKIILTALLLAAPHAHAITCPAPLEVPQGEGIETPAVVCGALGVFSQHGKKGFFDPSTGEIVVPAQFDDVYNNYVADTLTPVMKDGRWAYVDTRGKAHTAWEFEQVSLFPYDDALAIVGKAGRYGMIDRHGKTVVPLEYERMDGFMRREDNRGYTTVACKAGKCGYLDEKGNTLIALAYDDAGGFGADVAPVKKGDRWGYINLKGETVQPFAYEEAEAFSHNWAGSRDRVCVEAVKDGKQVAIDPQGNTLPEGTFCHPLPLPEA